MDFYHRPVLLDECIRALDIKEDGIYIDATLGGGGHSEEICKRLSKRGTLIGIDRDLDAINASKNRLKEYDCRKIFINSNYADIDEIIYESNVDKVDGVLIDLGVSSFQLDNPERGFSYMQDAPLDMRMSRNDKFSAFNVVNEYTQEELLRVIRDYGEERWAKRIVSFIVESRKEKEICTTQELVSIIKAAIPVSKRREGPHPAKRTFQAIRIEVNDELGGVRRAVDNFIGLLRTGGRLAIISFHSLEDRIVKERINEASNPCKCPKEFPICVCGKKPIVKKISGKPILPSTDELEINPRSRSAKLRVCEKI